jgi:hypothetical protein
MNSDKTVLDKYQLPIMFPKQFTELNETNRNRYYHRGSSPTGIGLPSCCSTYLEYNRKYGDTIVSGENPYSDNTPSFSQYLIYSIYGDNVLTNNDLTIILTYYNKHIAIQDGERLYGPFNQLNLNIISETAYNEENWIHGWKKYHHLNNLNIQVAPKNSKLPVLYQIAHRSVIEYLKAMNRIIILLKLNTLTPGTFQLAKHKIKQILRSTQTQYIKYTFNVALTRDSRGKMFVFEVIIYYTPNDNKIFLGKTTFLGSGTTDTILLPNGKDPTLFDTGIGNSAGRPLHPLQAKYSELIPENIANNMYLEYMYNTNKPKLQFNNSSTINMPFWQGSRQNKEQEPPYNTGYGSTSAMFPDKSFAQQKCMACFSDTG